MTRDEKGRFAKGQTGNPKGRPPKEREERYYEITMTACKFSDWQAIVKKAVEQAKRGDAVARKWLSDYLIGSPSQSLDVTSNGEQLQLSEDERIARALAIIEAARAGSGS